MNVGGSHTIRCERENVRKPALSPCYSKMLGYAYLTTEQAATICH